MSKQRFIGGLLGASPLLEEGFDLSSSSTTLTDVSWSIGTSVIHSFGFSSDGLNMYASDYVNNRILFQPLATAYDPSDTAPGNTIVSSGTNRPQFGLTVSPDGTKAVWDQNGGGYVDYVTFSTAWDASSAGTVSTYNLGVTNRGYSLDDTGTVAVFNNANGTIYRHSLSTAWDPSTSTFEESMNMVQTLGFSSGYSFRSFQWIRSGNSFLVAGINDGNVVRVDVTSPYTFTGASVHSNFAFESNGATEVRCFYWADNKLFVYDWNGNSSSDLFRYTDLVGPDRQTAGVGVLSLDEAGPEANGSRDRTQLNWGGIRGRDAVASSGSMVSSGVLSLNENLQSTY